MLESDHCSVAAPGHSLVRGDTTMIDTMAEATIRRLNLLKTAGNHITTINGAMTLRD